MDAQHITQRICGVCSVEHGLASVLAQEMAFKLTPAENGRILRNLIQAANFIASHIAHFYLLSGLDFVDVAMITGYQGKDSQLLSLQAWAKSQLASKAAVPVGPFLPRYTAKYLQDQDTNFGVLRHYLEAFDMRATAHKMGAVFAGKMPHAASLVPGGLTEKVTSLNIAIARSALEKLKVFVQESYLPDVLAVSRAFPEYFAAGRSPGNFLAFGVFPESEGGKSPLFPSGAVVGGSLQSVDVGAITEDVAKSFFSSASGKKPADGETVAAPDKAGAYSWLKAPRYQGQPMEVGPLARVMVAHQQPSDSSLKQASDLLLKALGRDIKDLNSVMGRHATRVLECGVLIDRCQMWLDQLKPDAPSFTDFSVPDSAQGFGLTEAARGALGHWLEIRQQKITNYQCVVPTTWNASPQDDRGVSGPIEQAIIGTAVADPQNPIEVVRVIRSFDPCLACAVH